MHPSSAQEDKKDEALATPPHLPKSRPEDREQRIRQLLRQRNLLVRAEPFVRDSGAPWPHLRLQITCHRAATAIYTNEPADATLQLVSGYFGTKCTAIESLVRLEVFDCSTWRPHPRSKDQQQTIRMTIEIAT